MYLKWKDDQSGKGVLSFIKNTFNDVFLLELKYVANAWGVGIYCDALSCLQNNIKLYKNTCVNLQTRVEGANWL